MRSLTLRYALGAVLCFFIKHARSYFLLCFKAASLLRVTEIQQRASAVFYCTFKEPFFRLTDARLRAGTDGGKSGGNGGSKPRKLRFTLRHRQQRYTTPRVGAFINRDSAINYLDGAWPRMRVTRYNRAIRRRDESNVTTSDVTRYNPSA